MHIIIYCGESHEAFSPKDETVGRGGSEEAVINLAREFSKLQHKVTVYNKCDAEGVYDKVTYKNYEDYDGEECDIMIVWRQSQHLFYLKNYKLAYYWLHDTMPVQDVVTAVQKAHKAIVLSTYHRRLYGQVPSDKIFLSRNGINTTQFSPKEKNKNHIIYASSYDRGLKELLEMWPEIKTEVQDAVLHICYGWDTWESISKKQGEEAYKNFLMVKEEFEELMNQEGIIHHGRIGHQELADLFETCEVWAYPTWWPEISCITAMKAQASGCIPVIIPTAAVAETIKYGKRTDRGYYYDLRGNVTRPQEALKQFAEKLIEVLRDDNYKKSEGEKARKYAIENLGWDKLAKGWIKEFKTEMEANGM